MIIGALFIIIQFGCYPWVPEFWVPNPHGYPRVIPKKTQNFELYGYPTRKYPWNLDTNPTQPIPEFWFGFGYYTWVPKCWIPNPRHTPYLFENDLCVSWLLNSDPMCSFMIWRCTDAIYFKDLSSEIKITLHLGMPIPR